MRLIDLDSIPWEIKARKRRKIPDENNDKWICSTEYEKVAYENDINEMPIVLETLKTGIVDERIFQCGSFGISTSTNMVNFSLSDSSLKDLMDVFEECDEIVGVSVLFKTRKYKLSQFEYDMIKYFADQKDGLKSFLGDWEIAKYLKEKGYFKDINLDVKISNIYLHCEVINDD